MAKRSNVSRSATHWGKLARQEQQRQERAYEAQSSPPFNKAAFLVGFDRVGPKTKALEIDRDRLVFMLGLDPSKWRLTATSDDRDGNKTYFHLKAKE